MMLAALGLGLVASIIAVCWVGSVLDARKARAQAQRRESLITSAAESQMHFASRDGDHAQAFERGKNNAAPGQNCLNGD